MTSPAYIDVLIEIPTRDLATSADPTRELWERMRTKADRECREAGAELRTDREPEVIVRQAHSALIGDMTLVASRWAVNVPDKVRATL